MRPSGSPTDRLIDEVANRLNARLAYRLLVAWIGIGSLVTLVVAGLCAMGGLPVPMVGYLMIGLACWGLAVVRWRSTRFDRAAAAVYADRRFELRDALATRVGFRTQGRCDPFSLLQMEQADRWAEQCTPQSLPVRPAWKLCAIAITFLALALTLALRAVFQGPSPEMRRENDVRQRVYQQAEAAKSAIQTAVDTLLTDTQEHNEASLIAAVPLRRWIGELQSTSDQTQALRQLAALEAKVRNAAKQIHSHQDAEVVQRAAESLEAGESSEAVQEKLLSREYDLAAQELEQMMPKGAPAAAAQHAALEQMRTLADAFQPRTVAAPDQPVPSDPPPVQQAAEELSDALAAWQADLKRASQQPTRLKDGEQGTSQLPASAEAARTALGKLSQQLKHFGAQQRTEEKMNALAQAISVAQSGLAQGAIATKAAGKGGGPPGLGSRNQRSTLPPTTTVASQSLQLSGIATNRGTTQVEIESTNQGHGHTVASHRPPQVHQFRQQVESFVHRDNVPPDVRNGVKQYFESIHEPSPATISLDHQDPAPRE